MAAERKLYLGGRVRRLRRELGLNQSAMAAEIGVSPSYLNHLERNQRPVTAQVLLRLAEAYDMDLKSFAAEGPDGTRPEQLAEIFADPMFADLGIPRYELLELADNAPVVADAVSRLYSALSELRRQPPAEGEEDERAAAALTPQGWVRDFIQAQRNHFPYLEEAAEMLAGALGDPLAITEPLRRRLKEGFGIEARIVPPELLDGASQHYDLHRKRLMLSSLLRAESRTFGLAYQLALVEFRPLLLRMIDAAAPPDRADQAPAAHELRQLCGRGDPDALPALRRGGGAASLRHRPAVRRVRRERRAGRAPADHARPNRRQRRSLLHAAGRFGRKHLQALRRRELPLFALSAAPARAGTCMPASRRPGASSPRSSRPRTASASSRSAAPSSVPSASIRARTARSPSASVATSSMHRGSPMPTASTSCGRR